MAAYCVGSINNTNLRGIGMRILLADWLAGGTTGPEWKSWASCA